MHADVKSDTGGTETLGVEKPHAETRVFQVPQLGHELLGVQSPPFTMPGVPAGHATPQVELVALGQRQSQLQVVSRRAFVVDGGEFLPGVKYFFTCRNGPPHSSWPGEVVGGRGVENAASSCGVNEAFDGPDGFGNIKVRAI